jgi:hypothetical protein
MLHFISWGRFLTALLLSTGLYYFAIILLCYRHKVFEWARKRVALTILCAASCGLLRAQDGNAAISQADSMMRGYFSTGITLMYSVSGVLALVGAIRVYRKWNDDEGHGQAYKAASAWFGSCLFIVIVASVLRSFFWPLKMGYYDNKRLLPHPTGHRPPRTI